MAGHVPETNNYSIYTSDVETYDGNTLHISPSLTTGDLNDVLEQLDSAIFALSVSPVTTLASDFILLSSTITGGTVTLTSGDSLTTNLTTIVSAIATLQTADTGYVTKALYDANTILKADTDNTPAALTVGASRIVGRTSGGSIAALTAAEVTTILGLVQRDSTNTVIKPYTTTDHFAVGAGTNADKRLITVLDNATFANCPYISWLHNIIGTDYGLVIQGYTGIDIVEKLASDNEDVFLWLASVGAATGTKTQNIKLSHQTGAIGTLRYWEIIKDGTTDISFNYWDGAVLNKYLTIDTSGNFLLSDGVAILGFLDEDNMVSDSDTHSVTQQSVKAYVDTELLALDTSLSGYIIDLQDKDDQSISTAEQHCLCVLGRWNFSYAFGTGSFSFGIVNYIPDNAVITDVWIDVVNAFTDDGINTSTIGIGIETVGAGAEDIKNAAQVGVFWTLGLKHATLDFSSAVPFKLTAARDITINIVMAGGATQLTAGDLVLYCTYFVSD